MSGRDHLSLFDDGAVRTDAWDRRIYAGIREQAKALQAAETGAAQRLPTAPLLYRDIWAGLFKAKPELMEEVSPALALNKKLLAEAMNTAEWEDLRESTRLDEWGAALGALSMGQKIVESLPPEAGEQVRQALEHGSSSRQYEDEAEFYRDIAQAALEKGDAEAAEQALTRAQDLLEKARRELQAASERADRAVSTVVPKILRQAVKKAAEEVSEVQEQAGTLAWGLNPGSPRALEGRRVFEIAQVLKEHPELRRIAVLAGRMVRIAMQKQRTKVKQEPSEVVDVRLGDDLTMVLPGELALLAHPVLKKEFYRKYAEGELLQYEVRGRERLGRGPIVCCIDSSGSMDDKCGSDTKNVWSRAVALTLLGIAAREKRAFAAVVFGSAVELKTFKWPDPGKASTQSVMKMATFAFRGGTDFEAPLRAALDVIKESAYRNADVIFITDGECSVRPEFLEEFRKMKRDREVSCYSIVLPPGTTDTVKMFSDQTFFTEVTDDAEVLDVVFSI